jgi:peptidoglycan-N-acetylglucosamine deacetylase
MIFEAASITLAAATAATTAVLARGAFHPRSRIFGPVVTRLEPANVPHVALTFDDGPTPGVTERVLELLEQRDMRATFFVIGQHAVEHPDLLRRIQDGGHDLGNHTFDHHRHGLFRHGRYWKEQIQSTDDAIVRATGHRPTWFRPPMGFKSPAIAMAARHTGHEIVTWTRRAFDGHLTTSGAIKNRLVGRINPGEIVLMHDGFEPGRPRDLSPMIDALPHVLDSLVQRGFHTSLLQALDSDGSSAPGPSGRHKNNTTP